MRKSEFKENFKSPPMEYRAKPFWAWNGNLDQDELSRQIHIMKEMGFGGFFMHSRTGLQTEYLSDEWFRLINNCADESEQLEMEAWLYDEDRWPSGIAGGMVTREKQYRAKFIELTVRDADFNAEYPPETIAVFACELKDGCFKKLRNLKNDMSVKEELLAQGEVLLIFHIVESECKDFYNGYTYLDTMNAEAVSRFLELTHERYAEKCGKRIGTSIRGIFTDEPHRGAMFSSFSEGRENRVPYTALLFPAFAEEYGYDLKSNLPYLFLRSEGNLFSKVALNYVKLCQKLFLENFASPIQKWCADHQMLFTGHVLHEDSLSAQTVMQGSLMQFYEYMDYPGIDILTEQNNCWWVVKQASSVARQLKKPFVLSELYGGTGWQMSLENYKQIGDWQALFGVNLRCPHLSWYTMQGEAKRDYPASIFYQSAWYREYEKLETYFARVGVFNSIGESSCELLVLSPIESVWGYCKMGAFSGLDAVDERIVYLEERYRETFDILVRNRIEFDYGEEEILKKYGKVEENRLYIGECCYKKVLVSGMDTIKGSTLKLLDLFRKNGGIVIFAGDIPKYIDGEKFPGIHKLTEKCLQVEFTKEQIVKNCSSGKEVKLTGSGSEDILSRTAIWGNEQYVMLLNTNRNESHEEIKMDVGEGCLVELWDARKGEIEPIYLNEKEKNCVITRFAPGEEKFYRITRQWPEKSSALYMGERTKQYEVDADVFSYALSEDNVFVLDWVTVEIGEQIICGDVLKADRKIREQLGFTARGGEMLQPWFIKKQQSAKNQKCSPLRLSYQFYINEIPSQLKLAFEYEEHVIRICVNGCKVNQKSAVHWIDTCFRCIEIPNKFLRVGENKISIEFEYQCDIGLEAVYLLGGFGVFQNKNTKEWEISKMAQTLSSGDVCSQGLPFYSGKIIYSLPKMKGNYHIKNLKFSGSCIKIRGNTEEILFAPPYCCKIEDPRELEVVLTRRNTFGPLHCADRERVAYGPDAFLTEAIAWQKDHVLIEQGLLETPECYLISI